jgi:hypothetical protein
LGHEGICVGSKFEGCVGDIRVNNKVGIANSGCGLKVTRFFEPGVSIVLMLKEFEVFDETFARFFLRGFFTESSEGVMFFPGSKPGFEDQCISPFRVVRLRNFVLVDRGCY